MVFGHLADPSSPLNNGPYTMRYRDENSNLRAHITTLRFGVGVLVLIIAGLMHGWQQAKEAVRIHIPPDLRMGAVIKANDVQPAHIYAFANTVFQQANHWENGQADYGQQLFSVSPYLTPPFMDSLKIDMDLRGKNGELSERARTIQPLSGQGFEERRVVVLSEDTWLVWLDYNIREYVKGIEVKNVSIRYPIRIVRYATDMETNPWGLALDGYSGDGPKVMKAHQPLPELPDIAQHPAQETPS